MQTPFARTIAPYALARRLPDWKLAPDAPRPNEQCGRVRCPDGTAMRHFWPNEFRSITPQLAHLLRITPGRSRTCNLRIRSPLLYPLSYGRRNHASCYALQGAGGNCVVWARSPMQNRNTIEHPGRSSDPQLGLQVPEKQSTHTIEDSFLLACERAEESIGQVVGGR